MSAVRSLGIYIHIPVCGHLCGYCDFYSVKESQVSNNFWPDYLNKLKEEFYFKEKDVLPGYHLTSIYFGGGTPSLAPAWFLNDLLEFILGRFTNNSGKIEISIEANPETITANLLTNYYSIGINRLSIGIQSLNEKVLKQLDRSAGLSKTLSALELASTGPIQNWSADIIYGIPGQTREILQHDLERIVKFQPAHLSAYALTVESNTIGNKSISEKRQFEHQELLWEYLPANGYSHYEISNFAKSVPGKDYRCVHNLSVWKYRPYLSLGTSGHSFINGKRYRTVSDINRYFRDPMKESVIEQKSFAVPDLFISTLRLNQRQGFGLFKRELTGDEFIKFLDILKRYEKENQVVIFKNGFSLTKTGMGFSNTILEELFASIA